MRLFKMFGAHRSAAFEVHIFLCNTQSFLVLCTVINYPLTSERLTQGKEKKVHPEKNIYKESSTCLKIRFV